MISRPSILDPLDADDDAILDQIHQNVHAAKNVGRFTGVDGLAHLGDAYTGEIVRAPLANETGNERLWRLINSKDKKGKPCGDGFIESSDTCHVGETETNKTSSYTSTQKDTDKKVAAYVGQKVESLYDLKKGGYIPAHEGVQDALDVLSNLKDANGWRSRVNVFRTDGVTADKLAQAMDKDWPKHGKLGALVDMLREGEPHAFVMVGKYAYDPILDSQKIDYESMNRFGRKLAETFAKAGIAPVPLGDKPKASTADILGHSHKLGAKEPEEELPHWKDFEKDHKPSKWLSAGAVVFDSQGRVAIRKVAGGFSGTDYSFAKGKVEKGETDEQAAHREVLEESGHAGSIVEDLGVHPGQASDTHFYLMKHESTHPEKMDKETESVEFLDPVAAADKLNSVRDLRVLVRAVAAMQKHIKA